jgi:hypothetical protein
MNSKVDRRALLASVGGAAAVLSAEVAMAAQPETQSLTPGAKRASDRLGFKYRFDDPDMDLFFVIACGWGRAGGLDIGEAYYVAQSIKDGDAESWVASFEASGDRQQKLADDWQAAGWKYQSAQARRAGVVVPTDPRIADMLIERPTSVRSPAALGAPHAKARWLETKLARPVGFLVLDFVHADGILEHHSVRAPEVEEPCAGCRMTTRAEYDGHTLTRQVVIGPQHVIIALDLMIDVVHARLGSWRQGDRVMNGVDSHERDVSDPVTDARIANLGPEPLVSHGIGRKETHMAEPRDARVPRCKVALTAAFRSDHQFDVVAGRVLEADKCLDLAQGAFARRSCVNRVTQLIQRRRGSAQVCFVFHLESDGLFDRITLVIAECMSSLVRTKVYRLAGLFADL